MTVLGNADKGQRKSWFNVGVVLDSRGTSTFDPPKAQIQGALITAQSNRDVRDATLFCSVESANFSRKTCQDKEKTAVRAAQSCDHGGYRKLICSCVSVVSTSDGQRAPPWSCSVIVVTEPVRTTQVISLHSYTQMFLFHRTLKPSGTKIPKLKYILQLDRRVLRERSERRGSLLKPVIE